MGDDKEDRLIATLVHLAAAQDRFAHEEERLAKGLSELTVEMREMNGSIKDHNTQLALGQQWIKYHAGDHETMNRRLDAMEKLAKTAIAIPTIIVVGGALAGILALIL